MTSIYGKIQEIQKKSINAVLCTVVNTKGSTPRKAGAKMIVYENSRIYGTLGGGEFERKVIEDALRIMDDKLPKLFRHDLLHQHGMCCGGMMEVFIEPVMKKNKLYIFGAGHTGQSLAKFSSILDFETVLIDDRKEYVDNCTIPEVNKMNLQFEQALQLLPFDEHTFICIMTYSHPIDRDILAFCIKKQHAYLGMIGSKRKVELTKKMFMQGLNISHEELEEVDMPMGINIGAEVPDEIALSIIARIIEVKNKTTVWKRK